MNLPFFCHQFGRVPQHVGDFSADLLGVPGGVNPAAMQIAFVVGGKARNVNAWVGVMPCIPGQPNWISVDGVWVPDKKLAAWKPSNPKGFASFVETAAAKSPRQLAAFANRVEAKAAEVEPLEAEQTFTKPPLLRIIQILKRHRDEFFKSNHDRAPISVVLTTLATHSYDRAVTSNTYQSAYDLMLNVVDGIYGRMGRGWHITRAVNLSSRHHITIFNEAPKTE